MREPFRKFRLIVSVLMILEILLGAAIIVVAAAFQNILGSFMTQRESKMLSSTLFNTYILGFQLIVSYLCSLSMWRSVWMRRYSLSIQLLLSIWLFFCFLIVICGCATTWSLMDSADVLSENVAMMLFQGIDVYYMNPDWKFLWDQLQYSRECCGVNGHMDWMHASWMPPAVITPVGPMLYRYADYANESGEESPTIRIITDCVGREHYSQTPDQPPSSHESESASIKYDEIAMEGEQTLAPYACCKHDSLSCYQNYLPRPDGSGTIPQLNLTEINAKGCLPLFEEYMWCAVNILLWLMLAAIIIDIFICCLTKYLMDRSDLNSYRELDNDMSFFDDDGNALVVVKCPPKVKCITLEESNSYDSDIANVCSDTEPCNCFCDYERSHVNDSAPTGVDINGPTKRADVILH